MKLLRNYFLFISLFLLYISSFGADLSNPQETVQHHLEVLQEDVFNPEEAAKTLYSLENVDEKELALRAIHLKQIYDALGDYILISEISNDIAYKDSLGRFRYHFGEKHLEQVSTHHTYLDDIYLEKVGSKWLYSKKTVASIPNIYKKVFPFGLHIFSNYTNQLSHDKVLGLYYWQYIGLLIIGLIIFTFYKGLNIFFNRILLRILHKYGYEDAVNKYVRPVVIPLTILVLILLLILLIPVLHFSGSMNQWVMLVLKAAIPITVIVIVYRIIDIFSVFLTKLAEKTESTLDDQLVPLVRKILKTIVILLGTLFILRNVLNYNIIPLLTGLSIGGIAFALAAQDTIRNFFGSLMIFVDRPFQMGDWISGNNIDGDVEEVGFRSTRIRTFHNSVISVPNGILANMTIDNMGLRQYRRYKTNITVTYDTPREKLDLFVEGLRMIVENHPDTRKDYYHVYFNGFNASSLDILFYIFFSVPTWGEELKAKHEVNLEIMRLAETLEVSFAFNTQTLHVDSFPEKQPASQQKDNNNNLREQLNTFYSSKN